MTVASPSTNTFKSPRGQILFQPVGMPAFPLGHSQFTRNVNITLNEIYSNEFAVRTKVLSEADQVDWTLNITCFNMIDYVTMIETLSDPTVINQVAAQDLTASGPAAIGSVIVLGKRKIVGPQSAGDPTASSVLVKAGAVELDEGIHYTVDYEGGFVSVLALPDGTLETAKLDITFDCAAAKGKGYFLGSKTEVRGRIIFLENVKPGRARTYHEYFDVGFTPDGDVSIVGDDANRQVQIKGTVYPVTSKPAGQQLAFIDGYYQ